MLKNLGLFSKISFAWLSLMIFFAIAGPLLPLPDPNEFSDVTGAGLFTSGHLLGTDLNGNDLLANVIIGTRNSLFIAIISVGLGSLLGGILGIAAGYLRGKTDYVLTVFFNIFLSIPNLILSLVLISVLATSPDPSQVVADGRRLIVIIISLTIVIVPILGRITRGSTLSWTNAEFVVAAKSMGMKDLTIIRRHIIPNVLPSIYAVAFLAIGIVIVVEGALSLLGIGVGQGISWGAMLARSQGDIEYAPTSLFVPLAFLALTVIACNQVGDALRQRLDSRESKL
jgi:peptide/nickel transport system permease protein